MLIDVFIRRLIDKPSWHRHLKRAPAGDMVSVIKWGAVNVACEKAGSGASGEISIRAFPKEVYGWYKSASLHTAKPRIPRAVWFILAAVICVPTLFFVAFSKLTQKAEVAKVKPVDAPAKVIASYAPGRSPVAASTLQGAPQVDYLAAHTPRIPGFPHTAPAFDSVTAPQQAPYPAACVDGVSPRTKKPECTCWSSQATKLLIPVDVCKQIASNGFFMEWKPVQAAQATQIASQAASIPPAVGVAPSKPSASLAAYTLASVELPAPVTDTAQSERDGANIGAIRTRQRRLSTP